MCLKECKLTWKKTYYKLLVFSFSILLQEAVKNLFLVQALEQVILSLGTMKK